MFQSMRATAFDSDAPPGDRRVIIRRDVADGKPELVELAWGLEPSAPGARPFRFLRSEGRRFPVNRCLVPASELHVSKGGHRYRVALEDGNWFYLAGIWRPATRAWPEAYAVLTVPANAELKRFQDRQSAIIRRNRHMQWLDLSVPEQDQLTSPPPRSFLVEELKRSVPAQPMLSFQVGVSRARDLDKPASKT